MTSEVLRIGGGAGFSGDRTDPAGPVVETLVARGGPAALIFETLAERTLALAQIARRQNPDGGYEPQLERFVGPILKPCVEHGIPIVGNFAAALRAGAQVVVTGRVADPSLAVGPAMAHYGWPEDRWETLGRASMAGHLLECGAQVTGGYFADPGLKDVPDLHAVGFPIAEIAADGSFVVTKAAHTGGLVDSRTVKEQLLYEVHDPAAYLTPDVVADISEADVHEIGEDRVAVTGVRGHPRPATLKVNVCFDGGWLGEAEISYAGPNAEARARLAADVIRRRIGDALEMRFDLIGVLSVFADDGGRAFAARAPGETRDVRMRAAAAHADRARVERLLAEVTALYCCGPAGGGGVRTSLRPRLSTTSCFVPRERVPARFEILE